MLAMASIASAQSSFDLPQTQAFDDPQSALNDRSNLQSPTYQDFIKTLYRFDAGNLHRANNLFDNSANSPGSTAQTPNDSNFAGSQRQPTYADYLRQQELQQQQQQAYSSYNGNIGNMRTEREASIIRPLFVYRVFQEKESKRAKDRAIRRLYKYRKSNSKKSNVRQSARQKQLAYSRTADV